MTIELIMIGTLQGLILALIAFGIAISFRFLNVPDLTAEGAYPLGGTICASLIISGMQAIAAVCISSLVGGIAAILTSQIIFRLKVNSLLAGIILSTMLYSVNLRILGKPNIALFDYAVLFGHDMVSNFLLLCGILISCILPFHLFLKTDFGLRFRSVGLNSDFGLKQGISSERYVILGLFISGALYALAGGLIVQMQHYMDIGMGIGIVIHALASLMIGEAVVSNNTVSGQIVAPIIGALIYQQIQGFVLLLGLAPSDLRLFTGVALLLVIALRKK